MGTRRSPWNRIAVATVVLVLTAVTSPSGAYTLGSRDHALLSYFGATEDTLSIYMSVTQWGTQYYDGIPPRNNGGLGDAVVCFAFCFDDGARGDGCFDGVAFTFETLTSLHIEDVLSADLYQHDDLVGTEAVSLNLTLTGTGAPYPGATAQLDPSPGARIQASFLRDAAIEGTMSSTTLGTIDLSPGAAVLGRDDCVAVLAGSDNAQACRF